MVTAFILLTVKAGTDQETMEKLRKYGGVKEVYEIYGAYDILAMLEVESEDELKNIQLNLERDENVWSVRIARVVNIWKREA
ncbi:Lrp/AsnC family transcriptional regulator [Candidatus Bathyarchaeota archaeon]|nr:MAG: Lrp/AsnC family transcriptional regulator [Candidatus Bathyarchaeota archaeon]